MRLLLSILVFTGLSLSGRYTEAQSRAYWDNLANDNLKKALELQELNKNVAKNIVFFLGDGMSVTTLTAARIYKGQLDGKTGEETVLSWEEFTSTGLAKTYNTDQQTPDSAGTATAFFNGIKTKAGAVGVDDQVTYGNCASSKNASVDSVMTLSMDAGKAVGFISTARITHATPACLYAHSPNRNWENDRDIPVEERPDGCIDIAAQLLEDGNKNIQVIMGGGRREMFDTDTADPEYPEENGQRTDGRNIVEEWLSDKDTSKAQYVWNLEDFDAVDPATTDHLIGLFEYSHMQYDNDRAADPAGEPSIAEMTEKAINILKKDEDGFFLMVEGGRIDHAHHGGRAIDALGDTVAFEAAVAKAVEMTDEENTLIIVTADHSHTMTFAGYPKRGNPILGTVDDQSGSDDLPYTTLSYANGPGGIAVGVSFNENGDRPNHTETDTGDANYLQDALVPLSSETHGGEDVAIFAHGPMAHLFYGTHEQNYIAHVVQYAACLGKYTEHCGINSAPFLAPGVTFWTILALGCVTRKLLSYE